MLCWNQVPEHWTWLIKPFSVPPVPGRPSFITTATRNCCTARCPTFPRRSLPRCYSHPYGWWERRYADVKMRKCAGEVKSQNSKVKNGKPLNEQMHAA